MEIRQFKLLNGDDIIAVMNTRYGDHYIIERPVQFAYDAYGRLHFSHWFPLSEQNMFKLYKNRCIQHVPITKVFEEAYTKFIINEEQPYSDDELLKRIEQLQDMVKEQKELSYDEYDEETPKKPPTIH
jgi:hypothetical protein